MPRKKTSPANAPETSQILIDTTPTENLETEKIKEPEIPQDEPAINSIEAIKEIPVDQTENNKPRAKTWMWFAIGLVSGMTAGYLICYNLFVIPLNAQLTNAIQMHTSGTASSNQIKSDFSNMQLRQQEMEIRYLKSAAQLEKANLYIFLLQMKEKTTLARLLVEQKKGLEARETLAEIKTLFNNIYPYIEKKDKASADDLDVLLSTAVQDLTADPETASQDLASISDHLSVVEAALFKME